MRRSARTAVIFVVLLISGMTCGYAQDSTDTSKILNEYAEVYGDIFTDGIESLDDGFLGKNYEFDAKSILKDLNSGRLFADEREIINLLLKILLDEVLISAKLMAIVLAMAVLSSYLSELKSGFGKDSVSECAFFVCYIIIAGIAATAFYEAVECTTLAVDKIAFFMRVLVPIMITILMTSGAVISAATLEPALLTMIEVTVFVIENALIPAAMASTALNIVGGMSDRFKTDRLVNLLNTAVRWGLTVTLTIFVSLSGLKSIAASGADGLAVRLSKFATTNLVPIVGGILSESAETVMNCSGVIRNSVGILGIICIVLIAAGPVIKLGAMAILMRLTAAVTELVSDPKIVGCLSRLASSVSVLFSMVTVVMVMFVMAVTIIINAGNIAVTLGG